MLLDKALWADRISVKKSLGTSPYALVYGKDTVLPTHLEMPALWMLDDDKDDLDPLNARLAQLIQLEEDREKAYEAFAKHASDTKRWFSKGSTAREFKARDLVLKWNV